MTGHGMRRLGRRLVSPPPGLALWHSVPLVSALSAITLRQAAEAGMTEQAQMETTQAQATGEPQATGEALAPSEALAADEALIAEELLVEEISIDGMCGVY